LVLMNATNPNPLSLLIVDDHAPMREVIRSLVSSFATEINECSDGGTVLEAYRRHRPDWVLMDIQMPHVDGLKATTQLCAAFPQARVIMVTDHAHPSLRAAAQRAGAVAYVVKENLLVLLQIVRDGRTPPEARLDAPVTKQWISIFAPFYFVPPLFPTS
jgi:two-component system NarL family response regulator